MIISVPEFSAEITIQKNTEQKMPPVPPPVSASVPPPVMPPVVANFIRLLKILESKGSLGNAEILDAFHGRRSYTAHVVRYAQAVTRMGGE